MYKVFIEYKIKQTKRAEYLQYIHDMKQKMMDAKVKNYLVYEGVDQPNLFVEEYLVDDLNEYEKLKDERLKAKTQLWQNVNSCLIDNKKPNIWVFQELPA